MSVDLLEASMSDQAKYWDNPAGDAETIENLPYDVVAQNFAKDPSLPQPETSATHKWIGALFGIGAFLLVLTIVLLTGKSTWLIFVIGPIAAVVVWYAVPRWIAWHPNRKV